MCGEAELQHAMSEKKLKSITEEEIQTICGYIRTGIDFVQAAVAFGFSYKKAQKYQKRIANPKTKNDRIVRDDVIRAIAQFEILQLQRIIQEGGASGAKWILERRLPGKYDKKTIAGQNRSADALLICEDDFREE